MDTGILIGLTLFCSAFAAGFLGLCAWGLSREWRSKRRGVPPPPGLRAANDWAGTLGFMCGVPALLGLAWLASTQEGWLRIIPLVLINLMMQPLCLLMLAGSLYSFIQSCRGRLGYALREIPRETVPEATYRSLVRHRLVTGIFGMAFACGLSWLFVWPFL